MKISLFFALGGRRRNITLESILIFVTGCDEELVLDYMLQPRIKFAVCNQSLIPTANVCVNRMTLYRLTSINDSFPENLFSLFDYALANRYKSLMASRFLLNRCLTILFTELISTFYVFWPFHEFKFQVYKLLLDREN